MDYHSVIYKHGIRDMGIGYLGNTLYRLGWRSAVRQDIAPLQHYLFSIFLYYRHGFTSGSDWIEKHNAEKILR